jgi:hypothetical protein
VREIWIICASFAGRAVCFYRERTYLAYAILSVHLASFRRLIYKIYI